ncbi:MAG: EAL domain-containing protein [Methyloprofundus sp.]|nr:EAL domain-containing protein [Methyloprofundus sp.]
MNKALEFLLLFFMLATLVLASSLYSKSQVDHQSYQDQTHLVNQINEQAAQLSLAIFLVAEGERLNYDNMTLSGKVLKELNQQLDLSQPENTKLQQINLLLIEQAEKIKSLHAVYHNSLFFLPKEMNDLQVQLKRSNQSPILAIQLAALQQHLLLFNLSPDTSNIQGFQQAIDTLSRHELNLKITPNNRLSLLLKHAQLIINYQQQLKQLFQHIINSPVATQVHVVLTAYASHFQASLNKAENIKKGFYIATLLLILSVIWALIRLKRALSKLYTNERSLRLAATVFEHSPEGIVLSDENNKILQVNKAFSEVTGYSAEDAIGNNPSILSSGMQDSTFYQAMWAEIKEHGLWSGELYNRRKNGEIYPEFLRVIAIKDPQNRLTHHIAIFNDLSGQKATEQHIHFLAHFDPLTDLANRSLFTDQLKKSILKGRKNQNSIALLFIDLDRFKEINENFGHKVGDQLLVQVANDIKHCVRETDSVARFGGDEFIVTIEEPTYDELVLNAPIIAEKILSTLSQQYHLGTAHAYISASIGIAIFPEDAPTAESLLQRADLAMHHAKEKGKNNYQFYSEALNVKAKRRAYIERELRLALSRNQLEVYYQPQYNILSKQIKSFEALLRWQHPELGFVPPEEFIAIAEESGLIVNIGLWVLETAVKQLVIWQKELYSELFIAINISVKQLETDELSQLVKSLLERTLLHPEYLELEVTENISIEDDSITLANLYKLNKLGVQLSMDDFGTGYSNMTYLKKLPIERLKIDRYFISDIPHDTNNVAIAQAIIVMAHSLGFSVIAEGVETLEQEEFLLNNGCYMGQGFLFSKPVPTQKATDLLRNEYEKKPPQLH